MAYDQAESQSKPLQRDARDKIREPTGNPKNPYGLGDPEDMSLRKVEKEIMIPMIMRDRAKEEKCTEVVKAFTDCAKDAGVAMVLKCRKENSALKECLGIWYNDENFKSECTEIYLKQRSQYRKTGIKQRDIKKYLA